MEIEIHNTTGAYGAARAAGFNSQNFKSYSDNVTKNDYTESFVPQKDKSSYIESYENWKKNLEKIIN